MLYCCEQCGTVLQPAAVACHACGKHFDTPVPSATDKTATGVDALLQGRIANAPHPSAPGDAPPLPPTRSHTAFTSPQRVWIGSAVIAGIILLLGTACFGAYTLWMRGPGGEIAYRQHNLAGNADVERGDNTAADAEYSQMIALRPQRLDGYLLRAISEFKEGLITQSINDDTAALARTTEPLERATLLYNRGQGYAYRGSWRLAIGDYGLYAGNPAISHGT